MTALCFVVVLPRFGCYRCIVGILTVQYASVPGTNEPFAIRPSKCPIFPVLLSRKNRSHAIARMLRNAASVCFDIHSPQL